MTTWTLRERTLSGMKVKDEINITVGFIIYENNQRISMKFKNLICCSSKNSQDLY